MSISEADRNLRAIAVDLIREHAESFEFSNIYEDDDLSELPEETQRRLFNLVVSADITATWKDSE
jgi:hypothetical protein